MNADGSPLNSDCSSNMFNFVASSRTLSIVSNDIYNMGSYHLIVQGELFPYDSIEFDIFVEVTKLRGDMFMTKYVPPNTDYSIFVDNIVDLEFNEWESDVVGCGAFSYSS